MSALASITRHRSIAAATLSLGLWFGTPVYGQPVGYVFGYEVHEQPAAGPCAVSGDNDFPIQLPLYSLNNRDTQQWWDNAVEEVAFSNATYVALNVRGNSPCGANPPAGNESPDYASYAVNAIYRRGYQNFLKIAYFDDTGSSPGLREQCGGPKSIDLGNASQRQTYFWDLKARPFFERVPDSLRMKINGRPLMIFWSINPGIGYTNHAGNLRLLIDEIRQYSMTTFGFDPFIVVDQSWTALDPTVSSRVDGVHSWFGVQNQGGSVSTVTNHSGYSGAFRTGAAHPGFWEPPANMFTDRAGGNTLHNALNHAMQSDLVILEGFTDVAENAAFYRGANLPAPSCGYPVPAGQTWAYPNQYLNIVREHTAPNPRYIVFEAEAADDFNGPSWAPNGLYRRSDGQRIEYTDASQSQWALLLGYDYWARFRSFQTGGSSNWTWRVRYQSWYGATARLYIDGVQVAQTTLHATGGAYGNADVRGVGFGAGSHDILLQVSAGEALVDSWTLDGLGVIPPGDRLSSGQSLSPAGSLTSQNGAFRLTYQTDGNLVIYRNSDGAAIWNSGTSGTSAGQLVMQGDGNLVIYNAGGTPVWATMTFGSGFSLHLDNDGIARIYTPGGGVVWSTAPPPSPDVVRLYDDINYAGAVLEATGDNEWVQEWNDRFSSIRVPAGKTVVLYSDWYFGGESLTLTGDVADLRDYPFPGGGTWNDMVSSFRIY